MKMLFENHSFNNSHCMQFVDMTDDVRGTVERSGVSDGVAVVYSPHTTCSVVINERESGFMQDFADLVQNLVSDELEYRHDDMSTRTENLEDDPHEVPNGHAHCKQS